jgi:hypothetical protein
MARKPASDVGANLVFAQTFGKIRISVIVSDTNTSSYRKIPPILCIIANRVEVKQWEK